MYTRFVCLLVVCLGLVSASPSPDVVARQASVTVPAALSSPTSITTTTTIESANGTMTETCVLAFTPVGGQIQEVRNCTVVMGSGSPQVATTLVAAPSSTASPMAAAAFVMPGTTIQVLPFGLGIYGGITSVAVFAVVFVTWERVQYRKAFRQQRMVENNIGYIGMTKGRV